MPNYLDFEKPIAELEGKIEELRHLSDDGNINIAEEVSRLQGKAERLLTQTYAKRRSSMTVSFSACAGGASSASRTRPAQALGMR